MKLKILLVPLLIVAILYLIIWVDGPAYFGAGGIREQQAKLAEAKSRVADISLKSDNAQKLMQELNVSADQKDVILNFLPMESGSGEIINSLSYLAYSGGLTVYNIAVDDKRPTEAENAGMTAPVAAGDAVTGTQIKMSDLNVRIGVVGPYDKIKGFVQQLSQLKRFNRINTMTVGPASETPGGDNLNADMVLGFNYLDKLNSVAAVDNNIFSQGQFDMSIVDQIKNRAGAAVPDVNIDTAGRSNPFLPQ